jgi:glycosyltransferase involved in cell wall biosynthesis
VTKSRAAAPVTIVVNTYNQARFLTDSLDSCMAQTIAAAQIIVIDDGSTTDDPGPVVARYPGVSLVRQANKGLSAARNAGLKAATSEFVLFLDADDRLTPIAIEAGLIKLKASPEAALAYGAYGYIDAEGGRLSRETFVPAGQSSFHDLLRRGNFIGMHGAVMYRRTGLLEAGGFNPSLRACEDYDLYLRLSQNRRFVSHPAVAAEYRRHGDQMSRDFSLMQSQALAVINAHSKDAPREAAAGRRAIRRHYALAAFRTAGLRLVAGPSRLAALGDMAGAFLKFPLATVGAMSAKLSPRAQAGRWD